MEHFQDIVYSNRKFNEEHLETAEYDGCSFMNCDLSAANLSSSRFLDCEFSNCNLSMANLDKTMLSGIKFKASKMFALRFESCNPFTMSFSFEDCQLNLSTFYECKVKKTVFRRSVLHEVDFSGADLTSSVFEECDLRDAKFQQTILRGSDFSSSYNFIIDPELNQVRHARFSLAGLPGLLNKYQIELTR